MKKLSEIFNITYGTDLELINCEESVYGIPFISRTSNNNGMVAKIKMRDDIDPMPGHAITVALGGSVLSSFFQKFPFYTSFHIACLYPLIEMTESEMIFYCAVIEKNKYKYNYGRQANTTLKDIMVPSPNDLPSNIINHKIEIPFDFTPLIRKKLELEVKNWEWFQIGDLFDIKKGKRLTKEDYIEGNIPFIGSTESNNGITAYVGNDEQLHPSGVITVTYNGSIANAFYQTKEFWATDDVNVLYPRFDLTKYIAIFVCTILEKEKYRYNYGRKWYAERMKVSKIKLPVDLKGVPDWKYMEKYIKSLAYSKNL